MDKKYLMNKGIIIYCPIRKATLKIGSEELDQMNEFTKYILYILGKKYTIDNISNILELSEYIIMEEVEYIIKIGLAIKKDGKFILTELGEKYYKLIEFLNIFKNSIKANVNCFNGLIYDDSKDLIEETNCNNEFYKLKIKIIKDLYKNKNISNSKEYFIKKYSYIINKYLSKEELEKVYVNVNFEEGDYYQEIYIDTASSIKNIYTEEEILTHDMVLVHPVIQFKFEIKIKKLDNYRYILPTLKKICEFQNDLLSATSYNLFDLEKEEEDINYSQETYYYDILTKDVSNSIGETVNLKEGSSIRIKNYEEEKVEISKKEIEKLFNNKPWFEINKIEINIHELEKKEYYEPINLIDFL